MIDPELNYCPSCDDEYIATAEKCAACGVVLISGREKVAADEAKQLRMKARKGDITPDDDIVTIHKAPLLEIKRLEKLLASEYISILITGDEKSCNKSCCPSSFYLNVRRDDAREALKIMETEYERTTRLDHDIDETHEAVFNPQAREVICPACGCVFAPTAPTCPDCGLCF